MTQLAVTRRDTIRGLFGLAALAVAPATLAKLPPDEVDRFMTMAKEGRVVGQTFLVRRPIMLSGLSDLVVTQCEFIGQGDFGNLSMLMIDDTSKNVYITHSKFDGGDAHNLKACIEFRGQSCSLRGAAMYPPVIGRFPKSISALT